MIAKKGLRAIFVAAAMLFVTGIALAGVNREGLISAGMNPSLANFASNVSSSEGNWSTINQFNCVGAFQFCPGTLERYYSGTRSQFANDPGAQVSAWKRYLADEWGKAERNGLTSMIGKQVCYKGKCATVTASSILKACQFGCGAGGKLAHVVAGGDCDSRGAKDGNLYSVCNYLISGSGLDVADITNMTEEDLANLGITDDPNGTGEGEDGSSEGSEIPAAFLMPIAPMSGEKAQPMMPGELTKLGNS